MTLPVLVAILIGGIAYCIHWDFDQINRWAPERARYQQRVQERQPMPTSDDYLECTRAAMTLTCRRYEQRLAEFVSERVDQDRYAEEVGRAYDAVELALAPGLRVVR